MPTNTAFSPLNTEDESAFSAPSVMSEMSDRRTSASPRADTMSCPNAEALSSEVCALIVVCTKSPLIWPAADVKLLAASAVRTSVGVTPSAAIFSGLSQMRIANVCPPRICALATPFTVCSFGCTTRVR